MIGNVSRAMLRGRQLSAYCYRAYASHHEFTTEKVNVTGCYGLMRDGVNYDSECESCGAFVHGNIAARVRELTEVEE